MHEQTTVSPVSTGEQHDAVRELIALGEEKGDLLREEIDALLPVGSVGDSYDNALAEFVIGLYTRKTGEANLTRSIRRMYGREPVDGLAASALP